MTDTQQSLPLFQAAPGDVNVAWLLGLLEGSDWLTAADILTHAQKPVTEGNKRWLRALAKASNGRVAGGQLGYKLVRNMTAEEYNHYRNWMKSQADEMTSRIIESDKVFYGRQPL
jgi:hypothetical protein